MNLAVKTATPARNDAVAQTAISQTAVREALSDAVRDAAVCATVAVGLAGIAVIHAIDTIAKRAEPLGLASVVVETLVIVGLSGFLANRSARVVARRSVSSRASCS